MRKLLRHQAFSLIELLVAIAIIALLMALLLPAIRAARQAGRRAVCISNMRQLGIAHRAYANDFKEFIASFNGLTTSAATGTRVEDCDQQAKSIIEGFLKKKGTDYTHAGTVLVNEQHSHLLLNSYNSESLLLPMYVCPEDRPRMAMQGAWKKPSLIATFKNSWNASNWSWWPFSSSYQLMPAAWAFDKCPIPTHPEWMLGPGDTHDQYHWPQAGPVTKGGSSHFAGTYLLPGFGGRKYADIAFPSQKVSVADSQQRHFGKRDLYYAYPEARQPLLFWDGSVTVRLTKDANKGWNPLLGADSSGAAVINYQPDLSFESPTIDGKNKAKVLGYYKWTRNGLRGLDFSGAEWIEK